MWCAACLARQSVACRYRRRRPEQSVLYGVVAEHLETFLAEIESEGRSLPGFVIGEFRKFLTCGVLAHGFLRISCEQCKTDQLVAFSCKGRGFCPSCGGRRMAETAARLVDHVIPEVPVRQWVLSVPVPLRYRMAFDKVLTSRVLAIFLRTVNTWYRRQARCLGLTGPRTGSVTFLQRFGSALNLTPHFHSLLLDGVYIETEDGHVFHGIAPPTGDDVQRLVETVAHRVIRMLERTGIMSEDDFGTDPLTDQPALAALVGESIGGRGHSRLRVPTGDEEPVPPQCAQSRGFSLHAATAVPAHDRDKLEKLIRYTARPPLATERLQVLPNSQLAYRLKKKWRDGTSHIYMTPRQLLAKLAALVPPPRMNLIRFHGVLAPNALARSEVVPVALGHQDAQPDAQRSPRRAKRYAWAKLLARVFAVDVEHCPECGGPVKIVAAIHERSALTRILRHLGLPHQPPTIAPARAPPHLELDFAS